MAKVGTSNSDRTISLRLQCEVKKHNIQDGTGKKESSICFDINRTDKRPLRSRRRASWQKFSRRFGETCYMHLRVTTVSRTRAVQDTGAGRKRHGSDSGPIRNVCSKVGKQNTFLPISFVTTVNYALQSSSTVYFIRTNKMVGRDSSVGIATVRGSNPGGRRDFPHPSRQALGPTQPPIQ